MSEEKKEIEKLSVSELSDAKGGIPYEKPSIIELSSTDGECGVGRCCLSGGRACTDGTVCAVGEC